MFLYSIDTVDYLWSFLILRGPNKHMLRKIARARIQKKLRELKSKMTRMQDSTMNALNPVHEGTQDEENTVKTIRIDEGNENQLKSKVNNAMTVKNQGA